MQYLIGFLLIFQVVRLFFTLAIRARRLVFRGLAELASYLEKR